MAKLFILPARDEPTAVIMRRGPSAWYHVIQWDTRRDQFSHGAWIKGRIYESQCDISPDGRLLVYFVHQGSRAGTDFSHAWTAVSRIPWLHALALWPRDGTYNGGGRFLTNREVVLRRNWFESDADTQSHPDFPANGLSIVWDKAPLHSSTGKVQDADWCGNDQEGNVIFTRGGCLFRRVGGIETLVADFTDLSPDPQPAPEWAKQPL